MGNKKIFQYVSSAGFVLCALSLVPDLWNFWQTILAIVAYILIALSLLLSKDILGKIGSGIGILLSIQYITKSIRYHSSPIWVLYNILLLMTFVSLLLAYIIPSKQKLFGICVGIIALVRFLAVISQQGIYLYYLSFTIGAVMFGLAANATEQAPSESSRKPAVAIANNSVENQIERLTKLKDLLDKGILTQEEFEDKKKQILG